MNKTFAAAMQQAMSSLRSRDVTAATRIVQQALGSSPAPQSAPPPAARPRRPLGEVIGSLRAPRPAGPRRAPAVPVPEGAQYLRRSFACAAGSRDYTLYIPAARPGGHRGLLLMLHGCTQNSDDFATGTAMNAVAETEGLLVAYPQQTKAANAMACWNWFEPSHQTRGAGEPAILAGLATALCDEFAVGRSQVYVAGLSAGGAMAAVLGETYPDVFAAVGVHSGLPYRSAHDVASAFAAMRGTQRPAPARDRTQSPSVVRTIVFQGSADQTVHMSNAEAIIAAALARMPTRGTPDRIAGTDGDRAFQRVSVSDAAGRPFVEYWEVSGAGHAWSGGNPRGSFTDAKGPDAAREMVRFFLAEARDL